MACTQEPVRSSSETHRGGNKVPMLVLLAVGSVSDISAFIVLVAIGFVVWLISDSSSSRKPRTMKY